MIPVRFGRLDSRQPVRDYTLPTHATSEVSVPLEAGANQLSSESGCIGLGKRNGAHMEYYG